MTTPYPRASVLKINPNDPTVLIPEVPYKFKGMSNKNVFVWDTMPLRNLNNEIVSIGGWSVMFTLTCPRRPKQYKDANGNYDITADWEDRHASAFIAYWYSKDGKSWIYGGRVMKEGVSPTIREWAGTPILVNSDGIVDLYYTCVEGTGEATIAKVTGKINIDAKAVYMADFTEVKELFKADGKFYQTLEQNPYYNFRDPSPFIDPVDGKLYMVFEGNVAGNRGSHIVGDKDIGIVPNASYKNVGGGKYQVGCVGLAVAKDMTGNEWELLPPLVTAVGVNDQTERPHFVFKDNKYYLFTISHKSTQADNLNMPDGVYGFVADSLQGTYQPLNSTGVVLANPSNQPTQTYSHLVMQNEYVTSFIDKIIAENGVDYRIGGVEAPTIKIVIDGNSTFLQSVHDYGYIPPMKNVTFTG